MGSSQAPHVDVMEGRHRDIVCVHVALCEFTHWAHFRRLCVQLMTFFCCEKYVTVAVDLDAGTLTELVCYYSIDLISVK